MFGLEVELLSDRYWACDFQDRTRPEWPPHPSRLFSALVAAAHATGLGEAARPVLLWLEQQHAPEIWASDAVAGANPVVFVPINDPRPGDSLPIQRMRQPRHFPSVLPEVPRVYFLWPDATLTEPERRILAQVADSVSYLGSARSLVRVAALDGMPQIESGLFHRYVPNPEGIHRFRVPAPGRLDELNLRYSLGQRPAPGPLAAYDLALPEQIRTQMPSAYGQWVVFRRVTGPAVGIEGAVHVAAAARAEALRLADAETEPYLSGRAHSPHCAWVALPFVDHPHATSHLLGVAAILPGTLAPHQRRRLYRHVARLRRLPIPGIGEWQLDLLTPETHPALVPINLQRQAWAEPRRYWASVTPVLVDRFPRTAAQAAEQVAAACERIGLPAPEQVELSRFSPIAGVPPVQRFHLRRWERDSIRPAFHVALTFRRAVAGPLLIGAGRFFGLGLLRPLREGRTYGHA